MNRAKSILYGATAFLIAAGNAIGSPTADMPADDMSMIDSTTTASAMYEIDEDHDGRTDRLLILEQSDSLA